MMPNPLLAALALVVRSTERKFRAAAHEVEVSHTEMKEMSPHGTFQEVPEPDRHVVKWQYLPEQYNRRGSDYARKRNARERS